jgi:hypothetical protein
MGRIGGIAIITIMLLHRVVAMPADKTNALITFA